MKVHHFILLFFVTALFACESLVTTLPEDKLPKTESKLVVQSFISPQASAIIVVVTESEPLFAVSNGLNVIKSASVKISDGVKEIVIPYDSLSRLYSIPKERFAISAGKTYTLSVSDAKRSVSATCKVPAGLAAIKTYVIDTTYENNGFSNDSILTLKTTWQDIASETNYYRVRASLHVEYSILDGNASGGYNERRVRNRLNFRWDDTIGRNDFQSDANLDGSVFSSPTGRVTLPSAIQYYNPKTNILQAFYPKNKILSITLEVCNTDEAYYKYHRSLETSDNDNPFTEPSLVYNNISGGLGCFAAYHVSQIIYTPK